MRVCASLKELYKSLANVEEVRERQSVKEGRYSLQSNLMSLNKEEKQQKEVAIKLSRMTMSGRRRRR